ncbi:hypothetical protein ABZZ44_23800 [Streptomyces sp. NPDC006460]|uniref:hypothetical protein n=1 Tax=Streptomyces sp. NPDC006460 TaxID=3154304 RepID=UPI0033A84C0B
MSRQPSSHPPQGDGTSRHPGKEQHGWSPDVDSTRQEENPSAERSFHTEENTPDTPSRSKRSAGSQKADEGTPVESHGRRGEDQSEKSGGQKGHHDLGRRGQSQRPSGGKDAEAYTGVDPQEPPERQRRG